MIALATKDGPVMVSLVLTLMNVPYQLMIAMLMPIVSIQKDLTLVHA